MPFPEIPKFDFRRQTAPQLANARHLTIVTAKISQAVHFFIRRVHSLPTTDNNELRYYCYCGTHGGRRLRRAHPRAHAQGPQGYLCPEQQSHDPEKVRRSLFRCRICAYHRFLQRPVLRVHRSRNPRPELQGHLRHRILQPVGTLQVLQDVLSSTTSTTALCPPPTRPTALPSTCSTGVDPSRDSSVKTPSPGEVLLLSTRLLASRPLLPSLS